MGTDGVVLVDDQWAKLAPRIKELVGTITDKPVRFSIKTTMTLYAYSLCATKERNHASEYLLKT
jgi:hypothetical protein